MPHFIKKCNVYDDDSFDDSFNDPVPAALLERFAQAQKKLKEAHAMSTPPAAPAAAPAAARAAAPPAPTAPKMRPDEIAMRLVAEKNKKKTAAVIKKWKRGSQPKSFCCKTCGKTHSSGSCQKKGSSGDSNQNRASFFSK